MPRGRVPHADRLQAQAAHTGAAPGGDEQPVAAQGGAAGQLEHVVVALAPRGRGVLPEVQLDALGAEHGAQRVAELPRLAGEDVVHALDHRDLGTETAQGLRGLHAHGAAAEHEQAPGDLGHRRGLAVGPHAVELAQPGHRRDDRLRAGGHDDVAGGQAAVAHDDRTWTVEAAVAADELDAVLLEPWERARVVVARDHVIAPGERRTGVERPGDRFARAGDRAGGGERLPGPQQGLGRDAAPVGALPADELALDERDPQAAVGQRARADLAGRPAAEDDGVDVRAPHAVRPRARSISFAAVMKPMWL